MKKLILATCLICLCGTVKGNDANDVNDSINFGIFTIPTTSSTTVEGWLGFRRGNSELGLIGGYVDEQSSEDSSYTAGVFAEYHFPDIRKKVENVFWVVDWLPEEIMAEVSVGTSGVYNFDTSSLKASPFIGLQFLESFKIITSYNAFGGDSPEADGIQIGITTKIWKF